MVDSSLLLLHVTKIIRLTFSPTSLEELEFFLQRQRPPTQGCISQLYCNPARARAEEIMSRRRRQPTPAEIGGRARGGFCKKNC